MQWPFKILVSLVLAGMTLPVVRHMRAFSALRSAFAHEPPHVRLAALAFLIASVIYGGGKTNGLNRVGGDLPERGQLVRIDDGGDGGESPSWRDGFALPGWFALAGYNDADTDGDGIPDCWERWTGTNPLVADSSSDLDGDGLSNLDEFLLQTDPQCADTDNDAIDDALEAAAMLAGVADFDPLSPATYAAQEPDANTNGVPDAWEGTMVDCPTRAVAYRGALFGAGGQPSLRGGTPGAGGGPLEISFVPKWMHLIYQGGNSCAEHGPSPMVELVSTNVPPPYRWSHDLHRSVTDSTQYCAELPWLDYTSTTVSCREADGAHTNLLLQADILIGLGRCGPSGMNIIPAMAGSTTILLMLQTTSLSFPSRKPANTARYARKRQTSHSRPDGRMTRRFCTSGTSCGY